MSEFKKWPAVMIDIETMGVHPGAPILQIAAVVFTPYQPDETRGVIVFFDETITLESNEKRGRSIEVDTLIWWANQWRTKGNIPDLTAGEDLREVLDRFSSWLKRHLASDAEIWARGSLDCQVLEQAFRSVSRIQAPWHFGQVRDVRTIAKWYDIRAQQATEHDALADCLAQIKTLQTARWADPSFAIKLRSSPVMDSPDFGGAWAEYRRQLAETAAVTVPEWETLPTEVQESFCAAWWVLLDQTPPSSPPNPPAAPLTGKKWREQYMGSNGQLYQMLR